MTFLISDDLMMEACLKYTIMLDYSLMSFAENECNGDAFQLCSVNINFLHSH